MPLDRVSELSWVFASVRDLQVLSIVLVELMHLNRAHRTRSTLTLVLRFEVHLDRELVQEYLLLLPDRH